MSQLVCSLVYNAADTMGIFLHANPQSIRYIAVY